MLVSGRRVCSKMMTVGLHERLSGRPRRAEALYRFIKYVKQFDHVWICKREDIAQHWSSNFGIK